MRFTSFLLTGMLGFSQAFHWGPRVVTRRATRLFSDAPATRINKIIQLDQPKVVDNLELKAGERVVVCRCWQSKKFPFCDGAHAAHNKATGDNVAPCIVTVK